MAEKGRGVPAGRRAGTPAKVCREQEDIREPAHGSIQRAVAPHKEAGVERIGLQVRSRAQEYEEALSNIIMAAAFLSEIGDEETDGGILDIDGAKYARVYPAQGAYSLGSNEADTYELVQNFEVSALK